MKFSKKSLAYFSIKNKKIYARYKKKPNLRDYLDLVKRGVIPRPHYALGILMAAHQAYKLGYEKISIIEFGCFNLDGLIDMEQHVKDIKEFINIEFDIFGFDYGKGLPKMKFHEADRMQEWDIGDYRFENKENLNSLKNAKIIWGNVNKTVKKFIKETDLTKAPIGFISNDLDYYTSTYKSFDLLKTKPSNFIARPILYFDDFFRSSKYEGEYLAIEMFNKKNKKKLSEILEFTEQLSMFWKKWTFLGTRFRYLIDFKHPKYKIRYHDLMVLLPDSKSNANLKDSDI
jgi:hypothetical protein